ncbi:MAG: Fic family protein [bacterium]
MIPIRPSNEEEFQEREAIGIIRASRFVRLYAKSKNPIDVSVVCNIHRTIFKEAWLDIAGVYRQENLEITFSKHKPPHHSQVPQLMQEADISLILKLKEIKSLQGVIIHDVHLSEEESLNLQKIIDLSAWVHHKITHIHPFREGNGRTARLAGNLILERFGLVGISIKIEKENKERYRKALTQIDEYADYEPLKEMISEGLLERYESI